MLHAGKHVGRIFTRRAMQQVVFHDGSDVALERQVTAISKNQHLHNMAVALMRSQFSLLRAAIAERHRPRAGGT